jgi:histidinol-phosphate/aromatic aminotransferase/cobyric acid decarboxylase-like protein
VLVNPNSPTGQHVDRSVLAPLLAAAPRATRIWLDETYIEYAGPDQSLERFAAGSANIVVCKSMSKAYALSGARSAYLCGPAGVIDALRRIAPPWSVSLPAQVAAVEALRDPSYYDGCYRRTHALRRELAERLRRIDGVEVLEGVANFVLCHLSPRLPTAGAVVAACRQRGVFLRDAGNMGKALGDRALRIAVKQADDNGRIVAAVAHAVAPRVEKGSGVFTVK